MQGVFRRIHELLLEDEVIQPSQVLPSEGPAQHLASAVQCLASRPHEFSYRHIGAETLLPGRQIVVPPELPSDEMLHLVSVSLFTAADDAHA